MQCCSLCPSQVNYLSVQLPGGGTTSPTNGVQSADGAQSTQPMGNTPTIYSGVDLQKTAQLRDALVQSSRHTAQQQWWLVVMSFVMLQLRKFMWALNYLSLLARAYQLLLPLPNSLAIHHSHISPAPSPLHLSPLPVSLIECPAHAQKLTSAYEKSYLCRV